jgi:3-oxoadipate enol-lactonase
MPRTRSGDIEINYTDRGSGEAVVFLPGLGMSEATWGVHAERVARTHRALSIDPRGSGASDTPDEPYLPETVAADVVAVLDDVGVERAHVVGQSMGGMIAQDLALRHPERVRSLVLVSTFGTTDEWSRALMESRRRLIAAGGLPLQFAVSIHFVFSPKAFRELGPFIAGLQERLSTHPPDEAAYLRQIDYIAAHDALSRLSELTMPVLVVAGGDDMLTSAIQNRELAAAAGARYEEFAEASHGLIWEEPDRFGALLDEHLMNGRDQI